jgi:hypothetical protein
MWHHIGSSSSRSLLVGTARVLFAMLAAPLGAWLGLHGGESLTGLIASLTGHTVAALKDMLIWSSVSGGAAGAAAGVWLALWLTRAGRGPQRIALVALGIVALEGAALMLVSYDWAKRSALPRVEYRRPAMPGSDNSGSRG